MATTSARLCPTVLRQSRDLQRSLTAEGSNLRGMWDYPETLDLNQIYSNDISEILRTYGVEAARAAIMREVGSVFGAYGISVDKRHLSLISDYMVKDKILFSHLVGSLTRTHPYFFDADV